MQSLYANNMVKANAADCDCLRVNVEENWRVELSQNFWFIFYLISQLQTNQNVKR